MKMLRITRTYGNLKRFQQIVSVLVKHGFSHVLAMLSLHEYLPGITTRVRHALTEDEGDLELSTPKRWARVLEELGPTYIKFGQLLATRTDLIPKEYADAFSKLQDQVEPLPADLIRAVIEVRLGITIEDAFKHFDNKPVASGSIGQVHHAVLKDGTKVVVKVKRPETDNRVRNDLDLLAELARLAEQYITELQVIRPRMIVEEFARMMDRELDFVGEASYTGKFERDWEDDEQVRVPKVYWEHVTRDTLVLERFEGKRLSNRQGLKDAGIDLKKLAYTLGRVFMRQFFVTGFFHADPHPGNIFVNSDSSVSLIDFGQMGHMSDELRRKLAMTLLALTEGDIDLIVDIYSEIGIFTDQTNQREFRGELTALIDRYYGVPIDRMEVGEAFQEALDVARRNGILLPREFVLLGKSFVTIISVIRELDPEFRADEVVRPFTREIFGNLLSPTGFFKRMSVFAYRFMSVVQSAPEDIRDLLEKARAGKIRVIFRHDGLDGLLNELDVVSNRITVGVIIAGVIIGSSIVLAAGETVGTIGVPWTEMEISVSAITAGTGFIVAMIMGLWIAWSIIRSRKY